MLVEKTPKLDFFTYTALILGIIAVGFPILYAIIAATLPIEDVSRVPMVMIPGNQLFHNLGEAWSRGHLGTQLFNSFIMASGITIGKITVSLLGAFSIVYFDYRFRVVAFATVFCTLMLPIEVRILPKHFWTTPVGLECPGAGWYCQLVCRARDQGHSGIQPS